MRPRPVAGPVNVYGIRIFSRAGVTVEDCEFAGLGGIAVAANFTNGHGLVVRGHVIRNSGATAMYFGSHDGTWGTLTGLVVERNCIRAGRAPDPEIGYGIQVKLDLDLVATGPTAEAAMDELAGAVEVQLWYARALKRFLVMAV